MTHSIRRFSIQKAVRGGGVGCIHVRMPSLWAVILRNNKTRSTGERNSINPADAALAEDFVEAGVAGLAKTIDLVSSLILTVMHTPSKVYRYGVTAKWLERASIIPLILSRGAQ